MTLFDRFRFFPPGDQSDGSKLHRVELRQRLHAPFELFVELRRPDHAVDLDGAIGDVVRLEIPSVEQPLTLSGIVVGIQQTSAEETGVSIYRLRIAPPLWLLGKRSGCRIFQDCSALKIATLTAAAHGGRVPPLGSEIDPEKDRREHVTQYHETDLAFVQRVLAAEGLCLIEKLDGSAGNRVVADTTMGGGREESVPFVPPGGLDPARAHVFAATFERELEVGQLAQRDFDFERPQLIHESTDADADAGAIEQALERYGYGVGSVSHDGGTAPTLLRAARSETMTAVLHTNFAAEAGTLLTLSGHPRESANRRWLVVEQSLVANADASRFELRVVPADRPWLPTAPPSPRVVGTQTAFVVGAPGQEIDVDRHGRVLLKFHWDRRAEAHAPTRRVRVSQGWAGPNRGFVCLPRVGDEVVVDFLDANPDRPLVVGRVHNAAALAPQQLPEEAALSTWRSRSTPGGQGFNEITLDDRAGDERVFVRAQRDAVVEVLNDAHVRVDGDVRSNVVGHAGGSVGKNGKLSIDGDAKLHVGGDLAVDAANINVTSRGALHETSAVHMVKTTLLTDVVDGPYQVIAGDYSVLSKSSILLLAGGSTIRMSSAGIAIDSSGPVTINGSVVKLNCD